MAYTLCYRQLILIKMKTIGGYEVVNFKKLEKPIEHGMLEPHIYSGVIKDVPTVKGKKQDFETTWDKFGRCSNWQREDCFIVI